VPELRLGKLPATRDNAVQFTTEGVLSDYSASTGFNPNAGPPGRNKTDKGSSVQQFSAGKPWDVVPGSPIKGGDHVCPVGKRKNVEVMTWGALQQMTPRVFRTYCDEAWTDVSPENYEMRWSGAYSSISRRSEPSSKRTVTTPSGSIRVTIPVPSVLCRTVSPV